jgi:hypothetical protein
MSNGKFTQQLNKLTSLRPGLASVHGLPTDVAAIQANSIQLLDNGINLGGQIQQLALTLGSKLKTDINSALGVVNSSPADKGKMLQLITELGSTQAQAQQVLTGIEGKANGYNDTRKKLSSNIVAITNVQSRLTLEKQGAESRLGDKKSEQKALEKKRLYFLALGPFGLVGLGIMIGLMVDASNDISDVERQIASINGSITQIGASQQSVQNVNVSVAGLQDQIVKIKTAVDLVCGNISDQIGHIKAAAASGDITTVKLFMSANLAIVASLLHDAD